jgi:3-oxoacyl-[acyl-carrier protein] reductase
LSSLDAFDGRVALVTGGAGGIGEAICRALAASGATVAVGYGSSSSPAERLAGELRGRAFGADLEDPAGPERLVRSVQRELGPVDVLVANHGRARKATYDEVDADEFDRTVAINLRAPFLLARAALGEMRERGYGRILFISSVAAFTGGVVGPHYASTKAGLHGLTHWLASRLAPDGVTVNALAPALIERTGMLPGGSDDLRARIPVGRLGTPDEVADLALSVLGNAYLTNQVFTLDGGMYAR